MSPAPMDSLNLGGRTGDIPENLRENLQRLATALRKDHGCRLQIIRERSVDSCSLRNSFSGSRCPELTALKTNSVKLVFSQSFEVTDGAA